MKRGPPKRALGAPALGDGGWAPGLEAGSICIAGGFSIPLSAVERLFIKGGSKPVTSTQYIGNLNML